MQRGNCHCFIESSLLYCGIRRGFYPGAVPSGPALGHTTQRARWEIFKLSLLRPSKRRNGLTIFSILSLQVCGLNQACNHLVYLSAKFGGLNQRINEIRSAECNKGLTSHGGLADLYVAIQSQGAQRRR